MGGGSESGEGVIDARPASSLELIREKETELSGRVLSAKREADEIVADARRQASAIIETAAQEAAESAQECARVLAEETEAKAESMMGEADVQASALSESIGSRIRDAVDYLMKRVVDG